MNNKLWESFFLLALVFITSFSAYFAEEESKTESEKEVIYSINWRTLEGEEHVLYERMLGEIKLVTRQKQTTEEIIRLLEDIEALPDSVREDTRNALKDKLGQSIWENFSPDLSIVLSLLEQSHKSVRMLAFEILEAAPYDKRLINHQIVQKLIDLLSSDDTDTEVRISIMGTFFASDAFDKIRPIAERLAYEHTDEELLRGTAGFLFGSFPGKNIRTEYVVRHFIDARPIVRQEAALYLAGFLGSDMPIDLEEAVVSELVSMITSSSLSPIVRGEAIEACSHWVDEKKVYKSLVGLLLNSNEWFSGVRGNHGPEHSIVKVIYTLQSSKKPDTLVHLRSIQNRLHEVPIEQQGKVEIALKIAIKHITKSAE